MNEEITLLEDFTCERLTAHECNMSLIPLFVNTKGMGLVDFFRKDAWNEDLTGETVTYIVKDKQGKICMFFSLKCSLMFDTPYDNRSNSDKVDFLSWLYSLTRVTDEHKKAESLNLLRYYYPDSDDPCVEIAVKKKILKQKNSDFEEENRVEKNENIFRVSNTYPAIELSHFCIDEDFKNTWKKIHTKHTFGECVFWEYVIPVIAHARELVGCKYLMLFAADTSEDERLVNYYANTLNFSRDGKLSTVKPIFDFSCLFMYQSVSELVKSQQKYFENLSDHNSDIDIV